MKNLKNQESGFIYIIIVIVVALLLMRYMGITFTGTFEWFRSLLYSTW
jgi:hypothetical protein